ncbi:hypothetical protein GGS_1422 [Streptococcus dysgalactiae subsp. equisimilis RE378]|nr:hypothetical protein GGS_1422 [Streptococcus dysgalactiae subsp. equisimilis RE378]
MLGCNLFQSTHPRRVRLSYFSYRDAQQYYISIHSPAKGETRNCSLTLASHKIFQSTHPRRVRLLTVMETMREPEFQSTHPRRVRQRQMTQFIEKRMEDIEVF